MLKSFSHHRSSSSSSPILHYAPTSQSLPTSPLSRRGSRSRGPIAQSTPPLRSKYVDAATQWSPRTILKLESPRVEPTRLGVEMEHAAPEPAPTPVPVPATATVTTMTSTSGAVPPGLSTSPTRTISEPESPGLKRRRSRDVPPPTITPSQPLPPKRSRGDESPTKILPLKYEFCPVEDMVVLIANMIQELIQTNDQLPPRNVVLTRFHSRTPPGISVVDYLHRLAKHATLTPPILLSMVYYIDRLCLLYPAFTINTLTVHRFLITAATVASKGLSDAFWNNATYARVGGIKITELGLLELDFLYRLDWKIVPNPEALVDYYQGLIERSTGYELESDDSDLDDDSGDEDKPMSPVGVETGQKTPGSENTDTATDEKWKAWMSDVSARRAGNNQEDEPA